MAITIKDPIDEILAKGQCFINQNQDASVLQIQAFLHATLPARYNEKINNLRRSATNQYRGNMDNYAPNCTFIEHQTINNPNNGNK